MATNYKKKPKPRAEKFPCFTKEQQKAYDNLPVRQRAYVKFRGQGNNKTQSYSMAGYSGKSLGQAACLLENSSPVIQELIGCLQGVNKLAQLTKPDSEINRQIDALAMQQSAENMLKVIEGADSETAKTIQFYRDVMNGKIQTEKTIIKKDAEGKVVETRIEKTSDIDSKMKARRELDKILGLTQLPDLGSLQMGDITVNIVDASRIDEKEDERNQIEIKQEDVVEVVKDDKPKSKSDEFFNSVNEE